MSVTMPSLRLPQGELDLSEPPAVRWRTRLPRQAKPRALQAIEQLGKLDAERYLIPWRQADNGLEIEVTFVPEGETAQLWPHYLARHTDPAVRLALVVHLAQFLVQDVSGCGGLLTPLMPALVCISPGRAKPWRLLPVPALDVSLGDWATADPRTWAWCDRGTILGRSPGEDPFLIGALFRHALTEEAATVGLPVQRRFRRLLSGRVGSFAALETAVRSAVPKSFEEEAASLLSFLKATLELDRRRRPAWSDAVARLSSLAQQLSFERLVSRWNYELQPELAQRLQRIAEDLSVARRPHPAPSQDDLLPEPLASLLRLVPVEGPGALRRYLAVVIDVASRGGESIPRVQSALEQLSLLDQANPLAELIDEAARLEIAHIQVRYLGVEADLLPVLRQGFDSKWNRAVCLALRARALAKTDEYIRISNYCKEGRGLVESAPQGGGPAGTYLIAYFDLLDGIAHIGGAAKLREFSFYADAFDRLCKAWQGASDVNARDLAEPAVRWIGQLSKSTRLLGGTRWYYVHLAIEAWFSALGITSDAVNKAGVPQTPWYDERRVFPT